MSAARILVVDDDRRQLAALRRLLKRSRFEVVTAESGRMGLRMAVRYPPDLVLLDVSMPTMSGHEFLRRFRRLEARGLVCSAEARQIGSLYEIPVIFLTALGAPRQRVTGLDAGAVDYITKPFDGDELRARIRCHLRRAWRQKQTAATTTSALLWLRDTVSRMRDSAQACAEPLRQVDTYLDLTEYVLGPKLRQDLLTRAKQELRRLSESLGSIARWPESTTAIDDDLQTMPLNRESAERKGRSQTSEAFA